MTKILTILSILGMVLTSWAGSENLLRNGSIEQGQGQSVPGWSFSRSSGISPESKTAIAEGKVLWGLVGEGSKRFLEITMPEPSSAHVWWLQEVKIVGGLTYSLTLQAMSSGDKMPRGNAGVFFRSADGKWLGYQPLRPFNVSGELKDFSMTFTAPDDAVTVGVRLGLDNPGRETLMVRFTDISLTEQ